MIEPLTQPEPWRDDAYNDFVLIDDDGVVVGGVTYDVTQDYDDDAPYDRVADSDYFVDFEP